jgi:ribonucleoside-diphosphate reductase subunit M2
MENVGSNFQEEIDIKEMKAFFSMSNAIEVIHNETYSTMIDTVIRNDEEKELMFDAIRNCEPLKRMAAWVFIWTQRDKPLTHRIFAFCCFEGVYFSSAGFCPVRWFGRNNKLPGFNQANEQISRDEKLHLDAGIALLLHLGFDPVNDQQDRQVLELIVETSSQILFDYIRSALKAELLGLSSDGLIEYAKCCYNYLTRSVGCEDYFKDAVNPYPWMKEMEMPNKTNFFEQRVTEYGKVNTDYNFMRLQRY